MNQDPRQLPPAYDPMPPQASFVTASHCHPIVSSACISVQRRIWPWTWLWICLFVTTALACSSESTKKAEGQPCRETSECNTFLECRNLVCAPVLSESVAETSALESPDTEIVSNQEPSSAPDSGEHSPESEPESSDHSEESVSEPEKDENTGDTAAESTQEMSVDVSDASEPIGPESAPEQISETPTIPTGMFLRCTVQNSCQSGLKCVDGFCVQSCYRFSDPLDCPSPTHYVCTDKEFCTLPCRNSAGRDDTTLCPVGMRCEGGACLAGASTAQGTGKEGENCQINGCDGTLGLVCLPQLSQCVKMCDPRVGTAKNPSCSAQEECVPEARFSLTPFSPLQGVCVPLPSKKQGESCDIFAQQCLTDLRCDTSNNAPVCRALCDVRKGTSLNATCNLREYCDGSGLTYPQGICKSLPARSTTGTDVFGATCTTTSCDSEKLLFCDGVENVCVKGCRPKDGVTTNSLCSLNEVCVEELSYFAGPVRSHWGGRCLPPAQRNLGETCDTLNQRCRAGLYCHNQRCSRECDASLGKENNPGCPASPTHHCQQLSTGLGICQTLCDPEQSLVTHPSCGVGQYCNCLDGQCCVGGVCPDVVYCAYSAVFAAGPKKAGETCSSQDPKNQCDGSRNLFCRLGICETSCDPRKGKANNPNCSSSQECIGGSGITEGSPFQGICVATGTRKAAESCDSLQRCQDPLVCIGGICEQPCDPKQGVTSHPSCADKRYCRKTLGIPLGGVCIPLPAGRIGKRLLGERCTNNPVFANKSCDESKEFTCDEGQWVCVNACQPKDGVTNNPKCGLLEECVEQIQSHRGGLCVPPASRKLGEWCDSTHWRCVTGLVCSAGQCQTPCDPAKGETANPNCSSLQHRCIRGSGFDQKSLGVCMISCDPTQGITTNTACTRTQLCLADSGKVTSGLCVPVRSPGTGPRLANDACRNDDPDLQCGPHLVCATFSFGTRCTPTCDRSQGRSACNSPGWACLASTQSSTGGYCSPP